MKERDNKGRFIKKGSEKAEKKTNNGGRSSDNKGRLIQFKKRLKSNNIYYV